MVKKHQMMNYNYSLDHTVIVDNGNLVSPTPSPPNSPRRLSYLHQPHAGPHSETGGHLPHLSTGVEDPPCDGDWAWQGPTLALRNTTYWEDRRRRLSAFLQGGAPGGDPCGAGGRFLCPCGERFSQRRPENPAASG